MIHRILSLLLFLSHVSWAATGIIVYQETKSEPSYGAPAFTTKTYITKDKFRTEENGSIVIGRMDKELIWIFEKTTQTYNEINSETIQQLSSSNSQDPIKPTGSFAELFRRTGKERRIGNWDCFEVAMIPEKRFGLFLFADSQSIWISKKSYPYGKTYLHKILQLLSPSKDGFDSILPVFGDGFPIEVRITSMNSVTTTTVTKIEENQSIDENLFEPLSGYTKQNVQDFFQNKGN
ncbi:MAG: hypothetical protein N2450_05540 [bacterium]|nr:hypothetical protein [bacterium]